MINNSVLLYLRNEENINEYRTPLVPKDAQILLENYFIIYVQSSNTRIYTDNEYKKIGCIITDDPWYDSKFKHALIIGIKEMKDLDKLLNNNHVFFSHSYKNQIGSDVILRAFYDSLSTIYDFEYFLDSNNKRIIAFGYHAGTVGCVLGLKQYFNGRGVKDRGVNDGAVKDLAPWKSFNSMIDYVKDSVLSMVEAKIAIIGADGRCGKGVQSVLKLFNLDFVNFDSRIDDIESLKTFDIIFNCIVLDKEYNKIWFDSDNKVNKKIVIIDISCDYSKPNNPIKLYNTPTTWNDPVFSFNEYIDIIAINNLPSLLPKESSDNFSKTFLNLLLEYKNNDVNNLWKKNYDIYQNVLYNKMLL
jgi:saccharopine dehydrogenase (NAD+, L-lysine-forming)